jgi:hypothetical protein
VACQGHGTGRLPPAVPDASTRLALYERADGIFDEARLLKPAAAPDEDAARLAPLLMLQVGEHGEAPALRDSTVYYRRSAVEIGDRSVERWTYLWSWGGPTEEPSTQGIRMTLDDDGFPGIVEVLRDSSGARLAFVSTAFENEATARVGAPLAGRRYSIEPSVVDAPEVVVAGVFEPGPTPLGPFVYVEARARDVAAVLCRCMPSQVDRVPATSEYRLEPLDPSIAAFGPDPLELRLR